MMDLIIPDVHSRKFWKEVVSNNINNVDKVIFLGDYVDPYPTDNNLYKNPEDCLKDIINLKKKFGDKCILLLGNHDLHYIWYEFPQSTRFNCFKEKTYVNIFKENLDLFNLVWIENDVIFSHAGITDYWANLIWEELKFLENEIPDIKDIAECLRDTPIKDCNYTYKELLGEVGRVRGGFSETGSCEWADVREHYKINEARQLIPIRYDGIYQVFGHTYMKKPLIYDTWACLDCGEKAFIMNGHEINEC